MTRTKTASPAATATPARVNKTAAFNALLDQRGPDLPSAEIIDRLGAAGIAMTPGMVSTYRANYLKKRAGGGGAAPQGKRGRPASATGTPVRERGTNGAQHRNGPRARLARMRAAATGDGAGYVVHKVQGAILVDDLETIRGIVDRSSATAVQRAAAAVAPVVQRVAGSA